MDSGNAVSNKVRTCLCSPTKHPGSFRCNFHRKTPNRRASQNQLDSATISKANSLRALLLQIIKPSSRDLQRRRNFQPKPSRFYYMNCHGNGVTLS
ncbi:hypothetical protein Nepgr_006423 [Nepenthes gracilis]|uniref:Uncharacterized protein n=1 Tax=Nepenthes gracilis TaxID=150966 RepID=A0AAD3S536_NEPGR|nr:hypothetical protein Nepgr_006423 [Nepenthes gracilis]